MTHLLVRRRHAPDRRVRHVVITKAGKQALTGARTALRAVDRQLHSALKLVRPQLRELLVRVAGSTGQAASCVTSPSDAPPR